MFLLHTITATGFVTVFSGAIPLKLNLGHSCGFFYRCRKNRDDINDFICMASKQFSYYHIECTVIDQLLIQRFDNACLLSNFVNAMNQMFVLLLHVPKTVHCYIAHCALLRFTCQLHWCLVLFVDT